MRDLRNLAFALAPPAGLANRGTHGLLNLRGGQRFAWFNKPSTLIFPIAKFIVSKHSKKQTTTITVNTLYYSCTFTANDCFYSKYTAFCILSFLDTLVILSLYFLTINADATLDCFGARFTKPSFCSCSARRFSKSGDAWFTKPEERIALCLV